MVKVLFRITRLAGIKALAPADPQAEEWLAKKKPDSHLMVDATQPRNLRYHRKFFAFLNVIFANQDRFVDFDLFREDLMIEMGYVERWVSRTGAIRERAKSISFSQMDQDEFDRVYKSFVEHVCTKVIPGLDDMDLEREVMEFLG
jgi:hypothetical protein